MENSVGNFVAIYCAFLEGTYFSLSRVLTPIPLPTALIKIAVFVFYVPRYRNEKIPTRFLSIGKKLFSPTYILPANILNLEYTGSEESNKRNERNQL